MSTPESGSPNLLDEFFSASPTTGLAGDAAEGAATAPVEQAATEPSEDVEEAVEVDEVEAVAEEGLPPVPARRSLPPPAPSRRGGKRAPAAPPPRGRSSAQASAPPPPPSLRATWPGIQEPGYPDMDALAPVPTQLDQEPQPPFEAAVEAASSPAKLEPATTPGGFSEGASDEETNAFFAGLEMPPADPEDAKAESPEASADTDMATALAASLSLRGDVPSGPSTEGATASSDPAAEDGAASGSLDIFAELPRPPAVHAAAEPGESSAWPSPAKIDEWDDDWAPSLSALGAKDPDRAEAQGSSTSPQAQAGDRAPFRLSLPPPPPPPLKRATLPLPRAPEMRAQAAAAVFAVPDLPKDGTASPPDAPAEPAATAETEPSISIEVSPFGAVDDPSREDLTRPLPPTELARLAASEDGRSESELLRDDVTIPLPGYDSSESEGSSRAILPDPYTSDTDLTRPLIPLGESASDGPRSLILPPLRPPPDASLEGGDVRHIVAVPPPTVGTVEDAPTIQIASSGSEYTPTSQLQRPFSPTRTSPGLRGVLPPIPKPAPVPTDFGKRGPSQSVAPVTGSVFPPFPPSGPARTRLLIALAAVAFGVLALAIGLRGRSGSLVVTVAGPSGAAVPGVSVRVDGTERCNTAPCIIKDLKPGMHLVSAAASGLQPSAERAVVLESGEQVAHHVILSGEERSTAGLSVAAIGTGLHVLVDGREVGAPPVTLNDVTPGEHTVRILGPERYYQPYEEVVKLERGEVRSLGPVRLRVLRGRLELRAGAGSEGAAVAVDGRRIWHLPATIELSADESHEVTAAKQGFNEMTQEIVFDGSAERSVTIAFGSDGSGSVAAPQVAYRSAGTNNGAPRFASTAPRSTTKQSLATTGGSEPPAASGGTATLDITSTPPAAVVVNGRPLGTTPLRGVHVGAGKQTVLFVHPSLGRKVASANVAPGGRAAIGVKF